MTNHELTFSKIKELLKSHFAGRVSEFEDGTHITVDSEIEEDSSIWIELDISGQLIVGFGLSHLHYFPKFDDLNKGFTRFLHFLTCKKRRAAYLKGDKCYKVEYDFENKNGVYENYTTASNFIFSFWSKKTKKITIENGFINLSEIESEIEEIKNTMHNNGYT
jgi:hypothetical protein